MQQHALEYLARMDGYESVDELIRSKVDDYAAQSLTYEQAAEELVADAWSGIFSTEADFKRWVEFQRGQAEKNAGEAGTVKKVMTRIREMLSGILNRAKEVLAIDPENRAALKAKRLAEAERKILQDEYFAHAETAMDNLRAAKAGDSKNAAALKTEDAAEKLDVRFKLQEGETSLVKEMNRNLDELKTMEIVANVRGNEVAFGRNKPENVSNINDYFDSIGNRVVRDGFGSVELNRLGAHDTIYHGSSAAKQAAVAAIPAVIEHGRQIGFESNWKERGYNTYVFAAPVSIDNTRLYEGVIVKEYIRENGRKAFYVHEVYWTDGSYVRIGESGKLEAKAKKRECSHTTFRNCAEPHRNGSGNIL